MEIIFEFFTGIIVVFLTGSFLAAVLKNFFHIKF